MATSSVQSETLFVTGYDIVEECEERSRVGVRPEFGKRLGRLVAQTHQC